MVGLLGRNPIWMLIPPLIMAGVLDNLPTLMQNVSDIQEAKDASRSALNPAYRRDQTEEYDYVIIGAGSAGAVVVNRLSREKDLRILVIQDGGNPNPFVEIPGLAGEVRFQPSTDYKYKMVKQRGSCLAENSYAKNCLFSRGIGLGGTSNIYSMTVVRGNPKDYDRWAELTGDSTWTYENILPIFRNQENYHGYYPPDPRYHGVNGESYVSQQQPSVYPNYFYKACQELGLSLDVDANANQTVGCGHLDVNVKRGKRWGSYDAFLKPILRRRNLNIYRYARATKIHFDGGMRATGVTYTRHGVTRYVKAKYEVVLCAGSIDSPKLLMLSGIGPTEHLKSVGVKPLLNLPVGTTLDDHLGVSVHFKVNKSKLAFIPDRDLTPQVIQKYILEGKGPPASPFFNPRTLLYVTSKEFNTPNWPDIEILPRGGYENTPLGNGKYLEKILVEVVLLRPLSFGELKLASANPNDPPIIDPKYFSNQSDLRRLSEGLNFALKLFGTTKAFQEIGATMIPVPNCDPSAKAKKYLECIVRQNTISFFHSTGTVKMGSDNDATAVVDTKLRVRGTTGLRVVDSSIMPTVPTGHTHTPTMMVGEMGARFILQERRRV